MKEELLSTKSERHLRAKSAFRENVVSILSEEHAIDPLIIQEEVIEYIEHDEFQIAYTGMVALLVQAKAKLTTQRFDEIVDMGKELQIPNGVTWDEEQAISWWKRLESLIEN